MFSAFNTYMTAKNQYDFDHSGELNASPAKVWQTLVDFQGWHGWWEGLERIEQLDNRTFLERGCRIRSSWRGALPYSLTFDTVVRSVVPETSLEFFVTGDLSGYGSCRLIPLHGDRCRTTRLVFSWHVAPTKLWFKMSAPIAHSVFRENHDKIMYKAARGLARVFHDLKVRS